MQQKVEVIMKQIDLTLTMDEVNAILSTLGQLPTSSGAFPLLMKIKQQADSAVSSYNGEIAESE